MMVMWTAVFSRLLQMNANMNEDDATAFGLIDLFIVNLKSLRFLYVFIWVIN